MSRVVYQHFSQEDRPFIDKGLEWLRKVEATYAPVLTPFVNPYQVSILEVLANTLGVGFSKTSDFLETEYERVLFYPDYFHPELEDFHLALLEIEHANKFEELTHAKILGTILNQLGIERKLFGDILLDKGRAQLVINRDFLSLFQDGIQRIGKTSVALVERPMLEKIQPKVDVQEKEILVSSLRLDALLATALKLSRKQASELIEKGLVQVNYRAIDKTDYLTKVDDLLSIRRFGRLKIIKDLGQTKKDKKRLLVQLLVSK